MELKRKIVLTIGYILLVILFIVSACNRTPKVNAEERVDEVVAYKQGVATTTSTEAFHYQEGCNENQPTATIFLY